MLFCFVLFLKAWAENLGFDQHLKVEESGKEKGQSLMFFS